MYPHTPTHPSVHQSEAMDALKLLPRKKEKSVVFIGLNLFGVKKIYKTATAECVNLNKITRQRAFIRYIIISNLILSNKGCEVTLCTKSDISTTFKPPQMKNTCAGAPPY